MALPPFRTDNSTLDYPGPINAPAPYPDTEKPPSCWIMIFTFPYRPNPLPTPSKDLQLALDIAYHNPSGNDNKYCHPSDRTIWEDTWVSIRSKPSSSRTRTEQTFLTTHLSAARSYPIGVDKTYIHNIITAEERGRAILSKLEDAITSNRPPPAKFRSLSWETLLEHYSPWNPHNISSPQILNPEIYHDLKVLLDSSQFLHHPHYPRPCNLNFTKIAWHNSDSDADPLHEAYYGLGTTKIIIETDAYRCRDELWLNNLSTLPFSELRWRSWKRVAEMEGFDVSGLRGVMVKNIDGKSGGDALRRIMKEMEKERPRRKVREVREGDRDWYRILGNDNVAGWVHMLADHQDELGGKRPVSIWVDRGTGGTFILPNISIVLGY